jgi:hypothetical protein
MPKMEGGVIQNLEIKLWLQDFVHTLAELYKQSFTAI